MDIVPPTAREEDVEDVLHGVTVRDPYRWLEDGDSSETRAWTEAQNALTRRVLDALPFRERVRSRLAELWSVGLLEAPRARGGRIFFARRGPDQDQAALFVRRDPHGADEPLVDPNAHGGAGLETIDWWYPSADGRLLAYGLSHGGDEMSTLHVLDVDARRTLPDRIPDTRYASVAFVPDGSGFYYTRYPVKGTVPPGEESYHKRVRFHRLGTPPDDDPLVFGEGRDRIDMPSVSLSRDGRWLLVHVSHGWAKVSLHLLDRERPELGFRAIGDDREAIFVGHVADGRLFVHTNCDAPNWRLVELDPAAPDLAAARVVIAERADVVLTDVDLVGGRVATAELEDATSHARVYALDGTLEREIALPDQGTIVMGSGEWDATSALFTFETYLRPARALRCDVTSGACDEIAALAPPPGFDPDAYEVRRVRCVSKDGTGVPVFLVHRKGLRPNGTNPALLTGYGGFNLNRTPLYSVGGTLWVEAGGVYAVAVLRGGGEFGEAWHRAGMLGGKQNVFDDFIAAAEWLVRERYTSTERLALWGGSNGGLLVGAALTQRPDLAKAVVCAVPLLDMLRYHHFQIARLWVPEYGSADDREQFAWLHAYSPYHHVREGERYPAVLFTTALGDSRVDPMHARKMAALLQKATGSGLPVLLRVESEAGHGVGKPRWKQVEEGADWWSFLFWQLGVETA